MTNKKENDKNKEHLWIIDPSTYSAGMINPASTIAGYMPISSMFAGGIDPNRFKDTSILINEEVQRQFKLLSGDRSYLDILKTDPVYSTFASDPTKFSFADSMPFSRFEIKNDEVLTNIHEPISEQKKEINELKLAIHALQLNDEEKDIKIQELTEKLEKKKRKTTKRKSKGSKHTRLNKIAELEVTVNSVKSKMGELSKYEKDLHHLHKSNIDKAKISND